MDKPLPEDEANSLMDCGFDLLRQCEFEKALDVGRCLERGRFSGGFEIQALALTGLDRRSDAIDVLETGVATVPDVWLLWQLLGNYRSDEGHYEDAFVAYSHAIELNGDLTSIEYNFANALVRAGRNDEAKAKLKALIFGDTFDGIDPELSSLILGLYEEISRESEPSSATGSIASKFVRNVVSFRRSRCGR